MSKDVYDEFVSWLERATRVSPPPGDISAYNVGLFETEEGYTAYLNGYHGYDPDDEDWACEEDYSPDERYFELPERFVKGKDWRAVHKEIVRFVARFVGSPEHKPSPVAAASAVTVGFDDGDLERVK